LIPKFYQYQSTNHYLEKNMAHKKGARLSSHSLCISFAYWHICPFALLFFTLLHQNSSPLW
jgi:hypothetical protein